MRVIARVVARVVALVAVLGGAAAGCSEAVAPGVEGDRLVIVGGDDQEAVTPFGGGHLIIGWGWMPDSLRVQLTDANGAPLADRTVTWTTPAGSVSPSVSTTDAEGTAAARWSFYASTTGWAPVGTYQAQAEVPGVPPATFIGHARAGVTIESISFTPDTVRIESGEAPGSVAVKVSDDRRDAALERVIVQLYNPSATSTDFQSTYSDLVPAGGTASTGEWAGSFTLPADAEHGAWSLGRLTFGWGCGGEHTATLLGEALEELGLTHQLHVVAGPSEMPADSPVRVGSPERPEATTLGTPC